MPIRVDVELEEFDGESVFTASGRTSVLEGRRVESFIAASESLEEVKAEITRQVKTVTVEEVQFVLSRAAQHASMLCLA